MKKTLIAFLIAFFITATGVATLPDGVHAVENNGKTGTKTVTGKKTSQKYKDGEALVLLDGEQAETKKKASKTMNLGSDITIVDLWAFDDVPQKKATPSSQRTFEDRSIALVKSKALSTKQLISKLKQNKSILTAEPNYTCKTLALPNDTYIKQQWAVKNTGQNGGTAGSDLKVDSLWSQGKTGTEKVVAILDTGVDYNHEDLKANMWENPYQGKLAGEHGFNFANGNDDPMDDNEHGTHCAGIIGAAGNNQKGISGVNQSAKIMALKFLDEDGYGDISSAVSAYSYVYKAIKLGVPVVAINNSWATFDDSDIFTEVINAVGAKGAVTVSAAGNDGDDLDEEDDDIVPACVDSDYNITVAASNESNQLTTFSTYGKEKVDIAAPGADILSSVPFDCFNPGLYGTDTDRLCSYFADYNAASESDISWGVPDASAIYTNGSAKTEVGLDASSYFGEDGKSLRIKVSGAEKGDLVAIDLPYEVKTTSEALSISTMVKAKGPKIEYSEDEDDDDDDLLDGLNESYICLADVPENKKVESINDVASASGLDFSMIDGESNYWSHLSLGSGAKKNVSAVQKRKLVLAIECGSGDGDIEVNFDDLGISKENVSSDQFGQYDFFNGTSMAAPQVTGAVALVKETMPESATADQVVNKVLGAVNKVDALSGKIATGGVLDFSKLGGSAPPKISGAEVNVAAKTIIINGNSLTADTTIKMGDAEVAKSDMTFKSAKQIIVKDKNWMNKTLDITVTNENGTSTKKNVYLVKGKTPYTKVKGADYETSLNAVGTDGTSFYTASSESKKLLKYVPSKKAFASVVKIKPESLFNMQKNHFAKEEFRFGPDLAYMDKKMYNLGKVCEVSNSDDEDDEDDYYDDEDDYYDDEDEEIIEPIPYTSESKIVVMGTTDKKASAIALPAEYDNIGNQTIAAYNGKLYVIGGYDYNTNKKCLSTLVKVYDPAKKKWSNGPSLPSGRASGKALQVGNSLVYTLGYTDADTCPANLIFDGKTWTTSKQTIKPYDSQKTKVQGKEYTLYKGDIGLYKGGLLYTGFPVDGLGDTFIYHAGKDTYSGTKYNYIIKRKSQTFTGTVAGTTLYGINEDDEMLTVKGLKSGLLKVTAKKYKTGTISGANKGVLPGQKVTLKAVPKKGYKVKSFKVAGKTIKGTSTTIRLTKNQTASATFVKATKKK